ncbi:MAG: DNA polymerase III subunit chi [Paucibacter sp.]|nr:DNA polymerase III subunit chi [Roseateles sp.]
MTQVTFYTGVPDRLGYLCRLLRKAYASGARIGVCGPAPMLDRLDRELWAFAPTEFVPHLRLRPGKAPAERLAGTPIVLAELPAELPHREVLVNLGDDIPGDVQDFARVLEVLSQEPEQLGIGRRRYRQYEQMGLRPEHHVVGS